MERVTRILAAKKINLWEYRALSKKVWNIWTSKIKESYLASNHSLKASLWPQRTCRAGGREVNVAQVETSSAGNAYMIHTIHSCRESWTNFELFSWATRKSINFQLRTISTDEKRRYIHLSWAVVSGIVPGIIFKHGLSFLLLLYICGVFYIWAFFSFTHFFSYSDEKHNVSLYL